MFGFIRSISFTVQVMIPVLAVILFGIAWALPGNLQPGNIYGNGFYYHPDEGWLYTLWAGLANTPLWAQILPSLLIAILIAILLVQTDMKNELTSKKSYGIAFVFLFLVTSNGHFFLFHPAMLAGYFMVLSSRFLLDLYKAETQYSVVFAMGFTWGVAILLYPPVALLIPALLVGLILMVTTGWRHWLVSLLGIAVPAILIGFFWFLLGDLKYEINTFLGWFKLRPGLIPVFISKEPIIAAWLGTVIIWAVVASIKYRNPKIQSRQLFQSNFILFLSIIIVAVFVKTVSLEILWLLVLPLSYLVTFWALRVQRAWVRELFFVTLLLAFTFFRIRNLV